MDRGGLGLPNLSDFILSLRTSCFKFELNCKWPTFVSSLLKSLTTDKINSNYLNPLFDACKYSRNLCEDKDEWIKKTRFCGTKLY